MGPEGAQNQEQLCWQRLATNYCSAQDGNQQLAASCQPLRTRVIQNGRSKRNLQTNTSEISVSIIHQTEETSQKLVFSSTLTQLIT